MFSLTLFGGNRIDASALAPGERLVCLVALGGLEVDYTACTEPPLTDILALTVMGGLNIKVRPEQPVRLDGFSLLGGRNVEPRRLPAPPGESEPDSGRDLPLEVVAYGLCSGINVERLKLE